MKSRLFSSLVLCALALSPACGGAAHNIPGTKVAESEENRAILQAIESYRLAVERKDSAALMLMASKDYWEDGGTPTGTDDYGYKGLKDVLAGRFQSADDIRYSMRYLKVRRNGSVAFVDVLIDLSWTIPDARGAPVRKDKRDQGQLVLKWDGERWKFLSGM